ncbi:MAG: hypothetical protein V3V35_03540, partial [Dehalococcoidia bacterium]
SLVATQVLIHASIVLGAVLIGAWIGSRTHSVMITFLEHTERGRAVVPPFVPQTDWSGVGYVLLASGVAVAAMTLWAGLTFIRTPIWRVLRRGEW